MTPKAKHMTPRASEDSEGSSQSPLRSTKITYGFYYLSRDAREALPQYQYRGADLSLLYKYVLSPLAAWCVDHLVPKSVAPNSITLFGLVLMMTAYTSYWYYVPTCEMDDKVEIPRWIFLWNFLAMLLYQTLDNMDGKQARRTGSSSPLGLLFDHGCDAVNSIFGSVNWIIGMALVPKDNLLECWALVFGPYAMFYIATWEQYHTGELILPTMNGPNEGLLGGALLSLTSWYYGPTFWQGTEWHEGLSNIFSIHSDLILRNCDIVILASCTGFVQEIILKSVAVTRKHGEAWATMLPVIVLATCFLAMGYCEPKIILSLPRTALHLSMLLFVEMSTELMLAHVTSQQFYPFRRWQLLPLIVLTIWTGTRNGSTDSIEYYLVAYTAGMAAYLSFKVVLVIREICQTLHIFCFDIVTPYKQGMTARDE